MDICDQIAAFINTNPEFLADLAQRSLKTGVEHGAKLCDSDSRLVPTSICKGAECSVDLRHLKCDSPDDMTGEIHTHVYRKEEGYDSDEFSLNDINSIIEGAHSNQKDYVSCRLATTPGENKIGCDKATYENIRKTPITELGKLNYYIYLGCKAGNVVEHAYNIANSMVTSLTEDPSFKERKKIFRAQQRFYEALDEYKGIKKKAMKIIYKNQLLTTCLEQRLNI